jgi:glycosyltransferase involved in cell wall biosynthesis
MLCNEPAVFIYSARMKLSVVIPAYNEENYIGPCLRAVSREAARSGHDVEIIVVNNASTDRTAEIAAGFPGVRVVDEPCKGLSRARDTGCRQARGELIMNVDADCLMPRGYISRVLPHFENPRLVLLSGPFFYYDMPQPAQIGSMFFYLFQFFPNVIGQRILGLGAIAQGGNFVVRRSMLEKVGGFNTAIAFYGEDTDIAIRLSRVGLVRFSMRLLMRTSARRLLKDGLLSAGYLAGINIIFMIFFGKPLTRAHTDVRE